MLSLVLDQQRSISVYCQFGMIATGYEKYGSQEELEKDAIERLFDVYVKVNKGCQRSGSSEWKITMRKLSKTSAYGGR